MREPLEQGAGPIWDRIAHGHRHGGPLDAGYGEDQPGHAVEVVGVEGSDRDEKVCVPGDPDHLDHLWDVAEEGDDRFESVLVDDRADVGAQRVSEVSGGDESVHRRQNTSLLPSGQPGLNGVPGHLEGGRQLHSGGAWGLAEGEQKAGV